MRGRYAKYGSCSRRRGTSGISTRRVSGASRSPSTVATESISIQRAIKPTKKSKVQNRTMAEMSEFIRSNIIFRTFLLLMMFVQTRDDCSRIHGALSGESNGTFLCVPSVLRLPVVSGRILVSTQVDLRNPQTSF